MNYFGGLIFSATTGRYSGEESLFYSVSTNFDIFIENDGML